MPDKKHNWTDEQKKLLVECIDGKWTLLVDKPTRDEPECNLCARYNANPGDRCQGCPVAEFTDFPVCRDTPYKAWSDVHWNLTVEGWNENPDEVQQLATAERDFLREVLEAGS